MSINDLQNFEELPVGWSQISLKEVLPILYGKGLPKAKRDESGPYPVYGSSGQLGNHSEAITKKGSLIIGRKGSVGEVYYSKNPCWPIDTVYFVEKAENISLRYFLYLLKGLNLGRLDRSTAIPGLSRDDYNSIEVAIAPANEQKRIVAEIEKQFSRLDEAVENLQRVKANLKRYKASVLKDAVEGKLTEHWRAEHPDVEPASKLLERILTERRKKWEEAEVAKIMAKGKVPKDDKWKKKYMEPPSPDVAGLIELPKGWAWTCMGQAFEVCIGATPSRRKTEYWNGSVPWVSSGEVAFCRIKMTRETISELGLKNTSTKVHPIGTVLLGMIGEGKTRGQAAILDIEACNNQNAAAIRVSETSILPEYIYLFLEKEYEDTRKRGSGGNQPAPNKSRVMGIPFPLPPLLEQLAIVEEIQQTLSNIESMSSIINLCLVRADRLRQSILKKAFSGKLLKFG